MVTIKKLKQIVYGEYSRFADFADKKMYARGLAERDSLFAALDELGQLRAEKAKREKSGCMCETLAATQSENIQLREEKARLEQLVKRMHAVAIPDGIPIRGLVEDIQDLRADLGHWVGVAAEETTKRIELGQQLAAKDADCAAMRQALVDIRDHHDNEGYANYQVSAMRRIAGEALEGKNV